LSYTQSFSYDSLNRLSTAQENNGASWSQTNGYDRYGNRWIDLGGGSQSLYFDTSTNRIAGWSYDAAGNLLNDGIHAYTFDAENKIKTVDGVTAYVYDGGGRRVRKLIGENLRMVYGIGGQLVAEFDGSNGALKKEYVYGGGTMVTIEPTAISSNGTQYATGDPLGSPRVITNSTGSIVSRHDYLPFGEELGVSVGGRTSGMGFGGADGLRQKFTSKERDNESGLHFFGARYYSATEGRFTSVDPSRKSVEPTDPQSWNRYSSFLGNPLKYTDRNGKWPTEIHNKIIDKAFPGLTDSQREVLKRASRQRDSLAMQTAQYAYTHAMRSPGQNPEEAKKATNAFIQDNERAAQQFQSAFQKSGQPGLSYSALLEFGNALHPVTDRTSPTHTDANGNPMVWPGVPVPGTSTFTPDMDYARKHAEGESNITDEQMNATVQAAREEFRRTFGDDFYKQAIDPSKQGSLEPPDKKPDPRDSEPEDDKMQWQEDDYEADVVRDDRIAQEGQ